MDTRREYFWLESNAISSSGQCDDIATHSNGRRENTRIEFITYSVYGKQDFKFKLKNPSESEGKISVAVYEITVGEKRVGQQQRQPTHLSDSDKTGAEAASTRRTERIDSAYIASSSQHITHYFELHLFYDGERIALHNAPSLSLSLSHLPRVCIIRLEEQRPARMAGST